ncbi:MAG: OsmC family protein [Nitrospirota bacterium]
MAGPEDLKEIVQKRMELMKRKPEAALYRPRVTSRHVRGLYTESRARRHVMKSDYPPPAGGEDLGPNPIEMLLGAFAACIEASFYEFAAHRGYRVDAVSVEVEGTLDLRGLFMIGDVPASFKDIRYTFSYGSLPTRCSATVPWWRASPPPCPLRARSTSKRRAGKSSCGGRHCRTEGPL